MNDDTRLCWWKYVAYNGLNKLTSVVGGVKVSRRSWCFHFSHQECVCNIIGGEYFIAGVKIKIDTLKFRINQGGAHEQWPRVLGANTLLADYKRVKEN